MTSQPMYHKESSSPGAAQDGRTLILSVDDDLGVLSARSKLLSAAGYAVLSATDGAQALEIFGNNPVGLVLLDYALEGIDGGVVAEAMKAHSPHVPIIMVSGMEVPEDCLARVNKFVRKGESPELLLQSIRELTSTPIHRAVPRRVSL
jgi:CheY-like chemotaxis protein